MDFIFGIGDGMKFLEEEFCLLKKMINPRICEMNPSLESKISKLTKISIFCSHCPYSDKTKIGDVIRFLMRAKEELKKINKYRN